MRTRPRRVARGTLSALVGLAVLAGCSDGEERPSVAPAAPLVSPEAVRLVDGPPEEALLGDPDDHTWSELDMAAVGTDEVLVTAYESEAPRAMFLGSVDDGTWAAVDPPPIAGEIDPQLTTVGQDAVLVGAPCPGNLTPDAEELPFCPAGHDGLAVWRFGHDDHAWHEVTLVPQASLGLVTFQIVGVIDDAVAVEINGNPRSQVLLVHLDGDVETLTDIPSGAIRVDLRCVTGEGVLVGVTFGGQGISTGPDARVSSLGGADLTVWRPGDDVWSPVGDVEVTEPQAVGCGADQITVVGENTPSLTVGEWRTLLPSGQSVDVGPLPPAALLGEEADYLGMQALNQHFATVGRNRQVLVRDFGDITNQELPPVRPRRVIVVSSQGTEVVTQTFADEAAIRVESVVGVGDGRVAALVIRSHERGQDERYDFGLLVAE